eukprot:CAMPEP_0196572040 /NCGR_PEP_ID=MMETSP1081-20130531/2164_1 /TAXON_ID=36882 /ORGANISM="Pyramimonas amylifera, Strain CCMP720" /LENGTH=262 /DNA_ID=CAMNT_0041889221 /DNA_START=210 /DNA_END=1001 /DNA_ORIENTATION=-
MADDMCLTMQAWMQNTSDVDQLDTVLPCISRQNTLHHLSASGRVVRQLLNQTNTAVWELRDFETFVGGTASRIYSQYPTICPTYGEEVYLSNVTQGAPLNWYYPFFPPDACNVTSENVPLQNCSSFYEFKEISDWCHASLELVEARQTMENILNCSRIVESTETILSYFCEPLRASTSVLWVGFLIISVALTPLVWIWLHVFIISQPVSSVDVLNISEVRHHAKNRGMGKVRRPSAQQIVRYPRRPGHMNAPRKQGLLPDVV